MTYKACTFSASANSLVHCLLNELTERFKMVQNQLHKYAVHIRARAVQPMNKHFLFFVFGLLSLSLPAAKAVQVIRAMRRLALAGGGWICKKGA